MIKKILLAFSGGLDTTYCILYLQQQQYDVHTVTVNTGGFTERELEELSGKAVGLGALSHRNLEITNEFYTKCVKYLIAGNVLKNNTYPLSVSAERAFQAKAIAEYANELQVDAIAHGSTGAGNDQVRFDMIFHTICPEKDIITPIRDHSISREEEISFLQQNGVAGNWEKSLYSINQGLWGTSVGGKETLTSHETLPESAYPGQLKKDKDEKVTITFENGEPVAINGKNESPVDCIHRLNEVAEPFAIGRNIHVGDTIIGIKGRVGFEAAAPMVLISAHHALEKHVLTKHQLMIKDQLSLTYGNLLHEGQYLEPAMRDIEALLDNSQQYVSGEVIISLAPYRFSVDGIRSPYDLMQSEFGKYGEMNNAWTGNDVRGFSKVFGNQNMIYYKIHQS
ncbi:MAG: argininosuccinate synthase [Cyclobacteriaceae bacterium]